MINKKAYNEVNEIIKNMPKNMQEKIPLKLRKTIEYNMDKKYTVNPRDIEDFNLLKDTKEILSVLYTDYFSTEYERKIILAKENMIKIINKN